jgi:peptidyl-prolyl cis-trans isomerase SurA
VLRNLIDETLQIQEAKTADATIDDAEVDDTFAAWLRKTSIRM